MSADAHSPARLSWRDPDGFVVNVEGRILRAVAPDKAARLKGLLASPWLQALIEAGAMPRTASLSDPPAVVRALGDWEWLEHERLGFPAHPHEITALQLFDSALLTVDIAISAASHGWVLKDASAWNVLHNGGRPVFVDLLSFEPFEPTGTWVAYGQFIRHFVLPLLLFNLRGITPAEIFLTHRDGVTPEHAHSLLRGRWVASPSVWEFVLLPKWLAGAGRRAIASGRQQSRPPLKPDMAAQLLLGLLQRLKRKLLALRPRGEDAASVWGRYEEDRSHYSSADLAAKRDFVRGHLGDCTTVLDLGCNAGEFSLLAAECGKTVVAADSDHSALSRLHDRVRSKPAAVQPLYLDIGRPTPAVGWENREIRSFLDRSQGVFDCILMLGLLHHLLVGERATLLMISELIERLGPRRVILEWVDPRDPKFRELSGLNADLYAGLDATRLETAMVRSFRLSACVKLPCATRVMYLWERS